MQSIQTLQSLIAAPFITCEFGGEQFGLKDLYKRETSTRYIDYVTSLIVDKKASGTVNTYSLAMTYTVQPGSDPNYIDYIISKAKDRAITFTYGDMGQPEYSYVKEKAIITQVTPSVQISSNSIQYTISATSSVALSYAINRTYPAKANTKPSDLIFNLLYVDKTSGLLDLFTGMRNRNWVELHKLIARNDIEVYIPLEKDITPLAYIKKLLSKMIASDGSFFAMVIHDEPQNTDGPYFEIINSNLHQGQGNTYSVDIDVGYPGSTPVFSFAASQNTSLALITEYQSKMDIGRIINIDNYGELLTAGTPSLAIRNGSEDASLRKWWENMTAYPINATLTTRGLIKPSILCDYININVLFFGQKYNYSGVYMVTGQRDTINSQGYRTELSLIRVSRG